LIPTRLHDLSPQNEAAILAAFSSDLPDPHNFAHEITRWKMRWGTIGEAVKPDDLAETLVQTNRHLYPNVYSALQLLITMPVTTATAERAFSVMRRVKSYLRSTMTTARISNLALMHAYKHMPVDIERVINTFDLTKHRYLMFS